MALNPDQINAAYQKILGRSADQSGLKTYAGFGDPSALEQDLLRSQEYKTKQQNQANSLAQQLAAQQQQLTSQANAAVAPGVQIQKNNAQTAYGNVNAQYDSQGRLAQNQADQQSLLERQQNDRLLGVLKGTYDRYQQSDPYTNNGINVASRNSYLAGQESQQATGLNQDLTARLSQIAQGLASTQQNIASGRLSATNEYNTALSNADLQGQQQAIGLQDTYAQRLRSQGVENFQLGQSIPAGQSANIPGVGFITGRQQLSPENAIQAFLNSQSNPDPLPEDIYNAIRRSLGGV